MEIQQSVHQWQFYVEMLMWLDTMFLYVNVQNKCCPLHYNRVHIAKLKVNVHELHKNLLKSNYIKHWWNSTPLNRQFGIIILQVQKVIKEARNQVNHHSHNGKTRWTHTDIWGIQVGKTRFTNTDITKTGTLALRHTESQN